MSLSTSFPTSSSLVYHVNLDSFRSSYLRLKSSSFQNIPLKDDGETFVSSGILQEQLVEDCTFNNFTIDFKSFHPPRGNLHKVTYTSIQKCYLRGTRISSSEDTFYGGIVSGISLKTLSSFKCVNSSFFDCSHSLLGHSSRSLPALQSNVDCNISSSEYSSSQNFSSCSSSATAKIKVRSTEMQFSFVGCNFSGCSGTYGGAIDCEGSSNYNVKNLTVSDCLFKNCIAFLSGGAIYISMTTTAIITSCSFGANTVLITSFFSGGGGALFISDAELSLSDSTFTNNSATFHIPLTGIVILLRW